MTPRKTKMTREERLIELLLRISSESTKHMIAVTEAIGELRTHVDGRVANIFNNCAETKERVAATAERQNTISEKLDAITDEIAALKNAISQLTSEIIELEKCAAATKALQERNGQKQIKPPDCNGNKQRSWKTKWWQSKEFFLILIILFLVLLIGAIMKVDLVFMLQQIVRILIGR